jgi:riboflavin-specific deaminase-like protein
VEFIADPRPFEELTRGWAKRLRTGKPYVRVKLGTSLDAAISIRRDAQTTITGASGAEVTHRLRKYADGILISASTAIADNPSLTLRGINGELLKNQPKRYILVRAHVPPRDLTVFTDGAAETVILCPDSFDENTFEGYDAQVVFYPTSGGLNAALEAIGTLGANSILIEPGQRLFTEIINGRILDELVTVTAGGFLGADSLKSYDGIATIEGSESPLRVMEHRLVPFDTTIFGDVVATMWRPRSEREK